MRLSPSDLETLGRYLYGPRWRCALARAIEVDERLVRRWRAGERPVSARCGDRIVVLVCAKHARTMDREIRGYLGMAAAMTSVGVRAALLPVPSVARPASGSG